MVDDNANADADDATVDGYRIEPPEDAFNVKGTELCPPFIGEVGGVIAKLLCDWNEKLWRY